MSPPGRPKGEYRRAQHEGSPMSAARRCAAARGLLLAGCATFSPDGGMDDVTRLAQERIGAPADAAVPATRDADAARARSARRCARRSRADAAVEVALLRNPALRARLGELGLAEADLVQAGRLRNPVFAYSNKRNADVTQIDRAFLVNVAALVMMPLTLEIEERRFTQSRLAAAAEIVATAAGSSRQAYVRAVAAQEMAAYAAQVVLSAEASSELARRMQQVGNWSRLAQMREQAYYAEATAQLARARDRRRWPNASSSRASWA